MSKNCIVMNDISIVNFNFGWTQLFRPKKNQLKSPLENGHMTNISTKAPFTLALLIRDKTITYQARTKIDSVNTHFGLGSVLSACLFSPYFKVGSGPVLSFDSG